MDRDEVKARYALVSTTANSSMIKVLSDTGVTPTSLRAVVKGFSIPIGATIGEISASQVFGIWLLPKRSAKILAQIFDVPENEADYKWQDAVWATLKRQAEERANSADLEASTRDGP